MRTWQGQFRTLKCQLEESIGLVLPKSHPVLQWCAFWAAGVLNRSAVKSHGRAVFEYACGHRTKIALARFGEAVLWRAKRHSGDLNKHDSEWRDGIYLGVAGMSSSLSIGTSSGIVRVVDYRLDPGSRWRKDVVESMQTLFEDYVAPTTSEPGVIVIDAEVRVPEGAPDPVSEVANTRRMILTPGDFKMHGYSAGGPGCIHLQRNTGTSRNHTEACSLRLEGALEQTDIGRLRKERAAAMRDDQLTHALEVEDALIQEETKRSAIVNGADSGTGDGRCSRGG